MPTLSVMGTSQSTGPTSSELQRQKFAASLVVDQQKVKLLVLSHTQLIHNRVCLCMFLWERRLTVYPSCHNLASFVMHLTMLSLYLSIPIDPLTIFVSQGLYMCYYVLCTFFTGYGSPKAPPEKWGDGSCHWHFLIRPLNKYIHCFSGPLTCMLFDMCINISKELRPYARKFLSGKCIIYSATSVNRPQWDQTLMVG